MNSVNIVLLLSVPSRQVWGRLTLRSNANRCMHRHRPATPFHTTIPLLGNRRTPKPMRDDGGCKHCVHHGDEREQDPVDDWIPRFAGVAPAGDLEQRDGDG